MSKPFPCIHPSTQFLPLIWGQIAEATCPRKKFRHLSPQRHSLKNLPKQTTKWHPNQMNKSPQQTSFYAKEQQLYPKRPQMHNLFTLSIGVSLATLQRKLISALCILFFRLQTKSCDLKWGLKESFDFQLNSLFTTMYQWNALITANKAPIHLSISCSRMCNLR